MARSLYIHFNRKVTVFLDFARRVVLKIDNADPETRSKRLDTIFTALKDRNMELTAPQAREFEALINDCGRSDLMTKIQISRPKMASGIGLAANSVEFPDRRLPGALTLFDGAGLALHQGHHYNP